MATQTPNVVEVTDRNFEQVVLEESANRPVIIDFWATWCEPCRTLGPILEGLAEEYGGAFLLAKVDVDRSPAISSAARVQSIPTVLAVYNGAFLDQFVGAQPKAEVKRFLDGVLAQAGVEPPVRKLQVPKDPEQAVRYWQAELEREAKNGPALLQLGRLYVQLGKLEEARGILEQVDASMEQFNAAQASLNVMGLLAEVGEAGGPEAVREGLRARPEDLRARYLAACAEAAEGGFVEALEVFVGLVARAPADVREAARKAAATVLQATGREDERIEALRRRLAQLIY